MSDETTMLTAEQVRETVEKHWHDLSADYDMPEATALPEYSYDWQAIADELNARAERTCEWTLKERWPNRTGDDHVYGYETGCGVRHTWWPDSLPKFCPTCGGKVKAVKR